MKYVVSFAVVLFASFFVCERASAQAEELEELALDIEKLAQYKQILTDLKKGYQILTAGYNTIRDVSQGQFQLHKLFLDGLLAVSPAVQKYKKVADIVDMELRMVSEYKSALGSYRSGGWFSPTELDYITSVYSNLIGLSLKNIDDLTSILTANKLRMSDDERISGIDKIYDDMRDKLFFLRSFNNSATVLSYQRARSQQGTSTLQQFSGLK